MASHEQTPGRRWASRVARAPATWLGGGLIGLGLAVWAIEDLPPARAADLIPHVDQSVSDDISREGRARVLVELRLAVGPPVAEGHLAGPAAVLGQRSDIASSQSQVIARLRGRLHTVLRRYLTVPYLALEVGPDALVELRASPLHVRRVLADTLKAPVLAESVPLIGGDLAWGAGFDGAGRVVAIVDTGVDGSHPFLAGKVVAEACFSKASSGQSESVCPGGEPVEIGPGAAAPCGVSGCSHGTHVAGIAAGNGAEAGVSYSGVAKGAGIVAVQVFSRFSGSTCGGASECVLAWTSDVIAGLEHVYTLRDQHAIAAVNLSLGGGLFSSPCANEPERPIIDHLRSVGIATVVAAGNGGSRTSLNSPACIPSAVSVGSTNESNGISSFTNAAPFLSLFAPGEVIDSSVPGGGFSPKMGTSMAAPHVAGAVALLKQAVPAAPVSDIVTALEQTGLPITDTRSGGTVTRPRASLLEALEALQAGINPTPVLTSLEPGATMAGDPAFTLLVMGEGFLPSSVVRWNGAPRATTFVSSGELEAAIPAGDLVAAGTAQVTVVTPQPGGGVSNALPFTLSPSPFACLPSVIVDNLAPGQSSTQVSFTGSWSTALAPQAFGVNRSLVSFGFRPGSYAWVTPVFSPTRSCTYQVYAWWTSALLRSGQVPYTVSGQAGGAVTRTFDQRAGGGQWKLHGTYTFPAGAFGAVTVSTQNGPAAADAVRFLLVP